MKTLIKISWRNIWRNRTRSLVIIVALVIGLMGGVFSAAMRQGTENQQFEETIENQISHIQIHHPQFIANPEPRFRIPNGFTIANELKQHPEIKAVSARTKFDGMVSSASMNSGVRILGVDPQAEGLTTGLVQMVFEGTYFEEEGRLPSVIIGGALADKLNAGVGSRVVLTFQDINNVIVSATFRVEGLYSLTSKSFEERTIFVRSCYLNELIGDVDAVTEIAMLINNPNDYREIANELQVLYGNTKVRHWAEISPNLYWVLEILKSSLIWIVAIVIMGVSFGVLNTILMSVLERVRELGVLMAVGMKRTKVFSMVVMETTMLCIIGGFFGIVFSYIMVSILGVRGVPMPGGEGLREYGYAAVVYPTMEPYFYFQIAVLIVVFAILASIYPALKAIRLVPAEAVRKE